MRSFIFVVLLALSRAESLPEPEPVVAVAEEEVADAAAAAPAGDELQAEALPDWVDVHNPPITEDDAAVLRNLGGGFGINFGPVGLGLGAGLGPNGLQLGGGAGFGTHYQNYGTPLGYKQFYAPRPSYGNYYSARNFGGGVGVNLGPFGFGLGAGLGPNGLQLGGGAGLGNHYQSYGTPQGYKQFYAPRPTYASYYNARNIGGGVGLNLGPIGLGLGAGLGPNGFRLGGGAGFGTHYQNYGTPLGYKQFYASRPSYGNYYSARNFGGGVGVNLGPFGFGLGAGLGPNGLQLGGGAGLGSHYQSYGTPQGYKKFYQAHPYPTYYN